MLHVFVLDVFRFRDRVVPIAFGLAPGAPQEIDARATRPTTFGSSVSRGRAVARLGEQQSRLHGRRLATALRALVSFCEGGVSIRMPSPEDFPDDACWQCKKPVTGREGAWVAWALANWEVYCYGCGGRRLRAKTQRLMRFSVFLTVLSVSAALIVAAVRIWGWLS